MPQPSALVDVLKAEVNSLRQRALEMEKECKFHTLFS